MVLSLSIRKSVYMLNINFILKYKLITKNIINIPYIILFNFCRLN